MTREKRWSDALESFPRLRKFPDAVRRNWGYWDAVADKRDHFCPMWRRGPRDKHFDKVYVAGYYEGMNAPLESEG